MIDPEIFKGINCEAHYHDFAYVVGSLARIARLALENETSGGDLELRQADVATPSKSSRR